MQIEKQDQEESVSVSIQFPRSLLMTLRETREQFEAEAKMALAAKLFEIKRLTSGQAASLAGIDRVRFLLDLHKYQVAAIDVTEEEFKAEVENA